MTPARVTTLVVGILTFRRPRELGALLAAVAERRAEVAPDVEVRVVVVDNDVDASAREVVVNAPMSGVEYVHEPTPGIAAARNRALLHATDADVLVFIDDDERPRPGWLTNLVSTWRTTGAAAVAGRVIPNYAAPVDPWIAAGGFFDRRCLPTGTVVPTAPAGNLLLDLAVVRRHSLRFDARMGLTGGEDTLFTSALTRAGERVVFCAESEVVDDVPLDRATRRWVLTRAFSHGNTTGLMDCGFPGPRSSVGRCAAVAAAGVARALVGLGRAGAATARFDSAGQARALRLVARGAGITVGAGGRAYIEYARPGQPRLAPAYDPERRGGLTHLARRVAAPVGSIESVIAGRPLLALTFDDGPDPHTTPALLDVLAEQHAHATFFVLVPRARRHRDLIDRILSEGHEVGLHGLDHRRLTTLPASVAADAIRRGRDSLREVTGRQVRYFRPPYGAQSLRTWWAARRLGLEPLFWTRTTWDWKEVPQDERVAKALQVRAGDIVLAHDGRAGHADGATESADAAPLEVDKVDLLRRALRGWQGVGLDVVTVGEALAAGSPRRRPIFTG